MANFKLKLESNIRRDVQLKADILKLKDHEICQRYKIEYEKRWEDLTAKKYNQEAEEVDDDWKVSNTSNN